MARPVSVRRGTRYLWVTYRIGLFSEAYSFRGAIWCD
ncbi:protein of unknown function [Aminobacter niigataensis]|nr:protein of unknown function [Aminobacter niigataensis]